MTGICICCWDGPCQKVSLDINKKISLKEGAEKISQSLKKLPPAYTFTNKRVDLVKTASGFMQEYQESMKRYKADTKHPLVI